MGFIKDLYSALKAVRQSNYPLKILSGDIMVRLDDAVCSHLYTLNFA